MAGMAGVRLRGLQAPREDLLDGLLKSCWLLDETNYHLIIFFPSPVFAMDQHCSFRMDVTKPVMQELAPCASCATLRCLTLNVAGDPFEWSPWGWHLCWTQTSLGIDWIWKFVFRCFSFRSVMQQMQNKIIKLFSHLVSGFALIPRSAKVLMKTGADGK